jgi:hypothetical protein
MTVSGACEITVVIVRCAMRILTPSPAPCAAVRLFTLACVRSIIASLKRYGESKSPPKQTMCCGDLFESHVSVPTRVAPFSLMAARQQHPPRCGKGISDLALQARSYGFVIDIFAPELFQHHLTVAPTGRQRIARLSVVGK